MPYTGNPYVAKVRRWAVNDVLSGRLSQSEAARKYGVTRSAVCKWMQRVPEHNQEYLYTRSSRPKSHPNQVTQKIVDRIVDLRKKHNRCAPVIHAYLIQEGYEVSVATVGRVLAREGLTQSKKRAKWGSRIARPLSDKPGALVEIDTMHVIKADYSRFYIYAVLDTYSRLGFAEYQPKCFQTASVSVISKATDYFGFPFLTVQSDNGPEFRNSFEHKLGLSGMQVRHSRVRRPNDNAHIERFIRTIQDECFKGNMPNEKLAPKQLKEYLEYYNNERLHLSLHLTTPRQFVSKVLH
jgi:transposase InsO family protein